MRRLGEVDRNTQLARRDRQAADVVEVLMRHDDGVEGMRLLAGKFHAPE